VQSPSVVLNVHILVNSCAAEIQNSGRTLIGGRLDQQELTTKHYLAGVKNNRLPPAHYMQHGP
jgi:hypothetical protein